MSFGRCVGSDWAPLEVLLPRSAPRDTAPYSGFFRAPVRFDQEVAALVFPARSWSSASRARTRLSAGGWRIAFAGLRPNSLPP